MKLDIVYPAWNRREFVEATFGLLVANTDWGRVANLVVYDDGSTDGTREWLDIAQSYWKVPTGIQERTGADILLFDTDLRSPPAIMNHYLTEVAPHTGANWLCKVDSDIALGPGWLDQMLASLYANPELDILGMAAGWTGIKDGPPSYQPAVHIGGVGLMRIATLQHYGPIPADGRQGFTQFQEKHPKLNIGWCVPDVQAVQLDLVPDEPWWSLTCEYARQGWARFREVDGERLPFWPPYTDESLWSWLNAAAPA